MFNNAVCGCFDGILPEPGLLQPGVRVARISLIEGGGGRHDSGPTVVLLTIIMIKTKMYMHIYIYIS